MIKVDTRWGTANTPGLSNGNCLPLTAVPHAMNYFAPQTRGDQGSFWFHPDDMSFEGIRLTHQASPWVGDFASLILMPFSGQASKGNLTSSYDRDSAIFSPELLAVDLLRYGISVKLTPSRYGAKLALTYRNSNAGLYLGLGQKAYYEVLDQHLVVGWVSNYAACEDPDFKCYFAIACDQPVVDHGDGYLDFGAITQQELTLATSFLSPAQARLNLKRLQELDFETMHQAAQASWEQVYRRIQVKHRDPDQEALFYHQLYRAFLFPTCFYELDEAHQPWHYQTLSQSKMPGVYYTNNGFWDTAKTLYPLYSLIAVEELEDILEGYANVYKEVGYLPKWLSPDERGMMPGMAIDLVIADSLSKGIGTQHAECFLEAMQKAANTKSPDPKYGRVVIHSDYVPASIPESVNQTLDNGLSDAAISLVAAQLGQDQLAAIYHQKSLSYRTLIDPQTHLMRAKDDKGQFISDFAPITWGGPYTEGSSLQNSFNATHDLAGYVAQVGGKGNFEALLDQVSNRLPEFNVGSYGAEIHEMTEMARLNFGQIAISNQPSFHIPYLYNWTDRPDKCQVIIKQLLEQAFQTGFELYPGDEDNGSLAAWYILSSLGFYPVELGKKRYALGLAYWDEAKISLSNGNTLTVTASPNCRQHQFVVARTWRGKSYQSLTISHEDLLLGGVLAMALGLVPPRTNR